MHKFLYSLPFRQQQQTGGRTDGRTDGRRPPSSRMFTLVTRQDIIPVRPKYFGMDLETVVKLLINKKYANHVIQNIGMAICLYDLIGLDETCIYQGEGEAFTRVKFRLIVFSPFLGQVLEGKITAQDREGIDVSLDFFNSVRIPASLMQDNTKFDNEMKEWVWSFKMPEEGAEEMPLPLYTGSVIRFCVHKTEYITVKESNRRKLATITGEQEGGRQNKGFNAPHPGAAANGAATNGGGPLLPRSRSRSSSFSMVDLKTSITPQNVPMESAMKIVGRINDNGLGLSDWWNNKAE